IDEIDLHHLLQLRGTVDACKVLQLVRHRVEPVECVDDEREECDGHCHESLRLEAKAEPDDEQRRQSDLRNRVDGDERRIEEGTKEGSVIEECSTQNAQCCAERKACETFLQGSESVDREVSRVREQFFERRNRTDKQILREVEDEDC